MNLVAGEIVQESAASRFRSARFEVALPEHFRTARPGAVTLGIRPEHVIVTRDGNGDLELPVRLVEPLARIRCSISIREPSAHSSPSPRASTWPTSRS